jgi:hydrogenase-1 operon protein HyaF
MLINESLTEKRSTMSRLAEIPVILVHDQAAQGCLPGAPGGPATSMVLALLNEIATKLDQLAENGQESSIDLRWLIGLPQDFRLLRETLGEGEVAATITTIGSTRVQETAIPCVWWITHYDGDGGRLGEFVEITEAPEILRSSRQSIQAGLADLQVRCAELDSSDPFSSNLPTAGSPS